MTARADHHRWFVLGIVMLGTFMAILDASIVNVALPHMKSAFGVNRDRIEWVATGFMLATAVVMPLVGWFVDRVGHKVLYIASLAMFTAGSALCALAWSYDSLIAARIVQAVGGGAIQPVGMAIVTELFEPHERGRALGIWGTGIMVGPAIGPTLGGYLTQWFSWRSIFSVNLPVGVVTLLLALTVMRAEDMDGRRRRPFDWWGFFFLSLALVAGLLALSEGQENGWTSTGIRTDFALAIVGAVMFVAVERTVAHPLLELGMFRIRNYTLAMVLAIFRSVGLFGGVFLLPIFLENLVGTTTIQTGLLMMPGALAVGVMMPIAGRLADRHSTALLVSLGTAITGASLILYGGLDPLSGKWTIIGPQLVRGAGLALMMAPLLAAALNAVPREKVATASSFLNVAQRVGGSFGIAVLNSYVTSAVHRHAVRIAAGLPIPGEEMQRLAARTADGLGRLSHAPVPDASTAVPLVAARTIGLRANVLGFQNGFVLAGVIVLASLPLAVFLKRSVPVRPAGPARVPSGAPPAFPGVANAGRRAGPWTEPDAEPDPGQEPSPA